MSDWLALTSRSFTGYSFNNFDSSSKYLYVNENITDLNTFTDVTIYILESKSYFSNLHASKFDRKISIKFKYVYYRRKITAGSQQSLRRFYTRLCGISLTPTLLSPWCGKVFSAKPSLSEGRQAGGRGVINCYGSHCISMLNFAWMKTKKKMTRRQMHRICVRNAREASKLCV